LDKTRSRIFRLTKWSALLAAGTLAVVACRPEDATPAPTVAATPSLVPVAASIVPSAEPTMAPTPEPTVAPTPEPTVAPTPEPTVAPTPEPTMAPTPEPTMAPTPEPTVAPTPEPTVAPTPEPTMAPTPEPTLAPVESASPVVSESPSASGIVAPTVSGSFTLPEDAVVPEGSTWTVQLQDTSLADAPATLIAEASGTFEDPSPTSIEFSIAYDPALIMETNTLTLLVRVEDSAGLLLYINDTSVPVLTDPDHTTEVEIPIVAASGAMDQATALPSESPVS